MEKFINKEILGTAKYILTKFVEILSKYYFVFIGLFFLHKALHLISYPSISLTSKIYVCMFVLICFTAYKDIRQDIKLIPFLISCFIFFMFVFFINKHGYQFWGKMLRWQMRKSIIVNLNPIFRSIPFNDGSFTRIYKSETLTWFFRMVYNNGFVLPVMLAIYRSALIKDFGKMIRYALSAHILQVFLITPFYLVFHLQEVWYVLGQPDGLNRHLTPHAAAGITLNCFPSMHTSICFAMFLLVLKENSRIFKVVYGFFCLSVIYSTLYLEIHWVLDIIGGMVLAYVTVKLSGFILDKLKMLLEKPLNIFYYKNVKTIYVNNYYLYTMKN